MKLASLMYVMVVYVNMFCYQVCYWILSSTDSHLVIFPGIITDGWSCDTPNSFNSFLNQTDPWTAVLKDTYSASAIDRVTIGCFLLSSLNAPLLTYTTGLSVVECLSCVKSASEYPTSCLSSMLRQYQQIAKNLLTAIKWASEGLKINSETIPMAWDISGQVAMAA